MASLHIAVLFGNEQLTRELLAEGYDANVYDERLGTPLSTAVLKGYRSIVKLLTENGADHNNERFTSALINSALDELGLPDSIETFKPGRGSSVQESKPQDSPETRKTERMLPDDKEMRSTDSAVTGPAIDSRFRIKVLFKKESGWEEAPNGDNVSLELKPTEDDCPVVRYMEPSEGGGWIMRRLGINGSRLCGFLSRVLENYPKVHLSRLKAIIDGDVRRGLDSGFIGLFHRMERFIKLSEEEIDPMTRDQTKLLLESLEICYNPLQYVVEESRANGLIEWENVWTIYRPGDIAILRSSGEDECKRLAARITKVSLKTWDRPYYFQVRLEVFDWNGSYSGYRKMHFHIKEYRGFKKITGFQIYPLSYDLDPDGIKKRLIQRGRKFESLRGYSFLTRTDFNVARVRNLLHMHSPAFLHTH
jgi:hypothetical protein